VSTWITHFEKVNGPFSFEMEYGYWTAIVLLSKERWHLQVWHRTNTNLTGFDTEYEPGHPGFDIATEAMRTAEAFFAQHKGEA
jgi:hypothetical protein